MGVQKTFTCDIIKMLSNAPALWVVATPIGNSKDISARAGEILAKADVILAEDTRRARFLLTTLGIKPAKLISFFEHNEEERQHDILELLKAGNTVALITDAGTPLVSDPGFRLVRAARQANIKVSPVPGPCAPVAALSASGLPPIPFSFLGFIPKTSDAKRSLFDKFSAIPGSLIFFERKNRLLNTLAAAFDILGPRQTAICRELTKEYEEFLIGNLADLSFIPQNLPGEITVIIGPEEETKKTSKEDLILLIDQALDEELKPRVAARIISEKCSGWSADEIYAIMEEIKKTDIEG